MKKITLLVAFVACAVVASAQLLLNENFEYTAATNLLGQGSWGLTGNAASPSIQVTASTITYSGYPSSGVGNELTLTTGEDLNKTFSEQTTGTIYLSCLVNVTAAPTSGDYFIHIGSTIIGSAYLGRTFVKAADNGKIVFGIMQASSGTQTYTTTTYDLNTTYLIVLKHDIAGKTSSIIVNPAMTTEPTTDWISNNTGNNSTTNVGSVGVRQPGAGAALNMKLDGIRVAKTWVDLFTATGLTTTKESKLELLVSGKNLIFKNIAEGSEVEIFSALGSKMQSSAVENGKVSIADLKAGIYVVRSGKLTQKISL